MEGIKKDRQRDLFLANNTIVNDRHAGIFLNAKKGGNALALNNFFSGKGKLGKGNIKSINNLGPLKNPRFVNPSRFDYNLSPNSKAVDSARTVDGLNLQSGNIQILKPTYQYKHKADKTPRKANKQLDIGAFEYQ